MSVTSSLLYREAVETLRQADIENATLEALWIIEEALGLGRLEIYAYSDDCIDSEASQKVRSLIARRASQEPLQYILGSQEFYGLEMVVQPGVLIPRPESELLVDEVLSRLGSHSQPVVVDVGTGSGCLAISMARGLRCGTVIASDRSVKALAVAQTNALKHGVYSRILWYVGDLLSPLSSRGLAGKVTAIIANLPYISHDEWDRLSPDVKNFEPRLALDGGSDGLDVYRRLWQEVPALLAPDGVVLIEIGIGQVDRLIQDIAAVKFLKIVKVQPDSQGIPRMVCLQRVG